MYICFGKIIINVNAIIIYNESFSLFAGPLYYHEQRVPLICTMYYSISRNIILRY